MNDEDFLLRAGCDRTIYLHGAIDPRERLRALADRPEARLAADSYGKGGAVALLEQRTADLLGKAAALFVIKGVTAQTALLRAVMAGRAGAVAIPALGHMAIDEADAVDHLVAAPIVRLGGDGPFGVEALDALDVLPAVCVVELPLRRAAYRLQPLAEIEAMSGWCRRHGTHFHIDGARLWEAAAGYGVAPSRIAALADSVYVSFYKGLGGLGGAALLGEPALLDAVAPWKTRLGGDLCTAFPYALSALEGLDRRLPRMADYVARARGLAAHLAESGRAIVPHVPQVNAFRIELPGAPDSLFQAHRAFARTRGIWLFNDFRPVASGRAVAEIVVGDAAMALTDADIGEWIAELVRG
jgi:threonine aldolase